MDHSTTTPYASAQQAAKAIAAACEPLPSLQEEDAFGAHFDRFGDAKIVLLGEASHGTSEFYRARAAITRRLIEQHNFNIVAVEADWPDAAYIDRYVRHRAATSDDRQAFTRFPAWMWHNEEVATFTEWLRQHNAELPFSQRTSFRGLDIYSLRASLFAVLDYLDRIDPEAAQAARQRYGCLTPWQSEPALYGHALLQEEQDTCEEAVVEQLQALLEHRIEYMAKEGEEAYFNATQNARVVRAAEQYYRLMYRGSTQSWNLRDRHMFDTLQQVIEAKGADAKVVVWAHNSHIGNASATEMGWQGQFNIGELCRTAYGDQAVLIGFGTHTGIVAAADNWDSPMKIKQIVPSRADSFERIFHETQLPRALIELRNPQHSKVREQLTQTRLERAIGVIYRPESEYYSHYFKASLAEQFDAYVWFDETTAVTPLPSERPQGVPDTYPFGV
ncbi:erythromycin esterase family protein [Vreelandella maris]|uniref:Erythromycin esterase family protein n=1 Tax=Vreelandella maris TaxID=2729617 RepID=A0A7Y6RDL5_9GAMM|nr:erythromycin esterase family protein [Halomonas maris]NVF14947.1 erythromycin esterase family protein [Halomonas maris]